jgi:nucleoside-diphosphate-sugar epimerase
MAVTVVGAQGFVGRRLVERLRRAGEAPWTPAKGDPFDTVAAHASLVAQILAAGRFERFVYLSSTRLYDGLPKHEVDEAEPLVFDPADPRRVYDLSKALGENLTLTRAGGRGRVARLANVYDWQAGAPGFLSEWLIRARIERDLVLNSSPAVARDYIHLDDVVEALIAIAGSPGPAIVNVASGELVTNGEIAEVFEEAGWRVTFTGEAKAAPPPNAAARRLAALGVRPRPVREVVRAHLKELSA